MACAIPQAIERLLANPTIRARLPAKNPMINVLLLVIANRLFWHILAHFGTFLYLLRITNDMERKGVWTSTSRFFETFPK